MPLLTSCQVKCWPVLEPRPLTYVIILYQRRARMAYDKNKAPSGRHREIRVGWPRQYLTLAWASASISFWALLLLSWNTFS
jgi:hypothetical protein